MMMAKRVRLGGLAVPAVALGVIVTLALGHSQAETSQAVTDGAMAVDCDTTEGGIQSDCIYPPGASFQVEVHVTDPPADGYFQIQAKLEWTEGALNYLPAESYADETLWSECTIPARSNNWEDYGVPSVLLACAPQPDLPVGDTFTGAVFTFEFQCESAPDAVSALGLDPNESVLDLISSVNELPPLQGGTIFSDSFLEPIDPALTGATVACGDVPGTGGEPGVSGSFVQDVTVSPALPATGAALDADGGFSAGLWALIGALLVVAAAGLALFGRRSSRPR